MGFVCLFPVEEKGFDWVVLWFGLVSSGNGTFSCGTFISKLFIYFSFINQ